MKSTNTTVICACTSYWSNEDDYKAKFSGVRNELDDPITRSRCYYLNPVYKGRFGLGKWKAKMIETFQPADLIISCGTWSNPTTNRMKVTVLNSGVRQTKPHSSHWQYMGCALTALMAYLCNRNDWDVLILMEPDVLLGPVDWSSIITEFMQRDEEVFGPAWYDRACDFVGWKRSAAVKWLHQRLRPNLSDDPNVMWLDDELDRLFRATWWNPWPEIKTVRQDWGHDPKASSLNGVVMSWPMVRLPDPSIVEAYDGLPNPFVKSRESP